MASRGRRDPYRLLGVSRDATRDEVTLAYVRHTARADLETEGPWRKDIETAFRLLWRPRTRARYDKLYRASVRRMRWTSGVGSVSVLLLVLVGLTSGFWLASQDSHPGSLRASLPFIRPVPAPTAARAARSPSLNPASITLTAGDLPSGYHMLSNGPVSFSTGSSGASQNGAAPPSWDVVFARDSGQASGRRLVESLAVIYPQTSGARQALAQVEAAEAAQPATRQAPPTGLGRDAGQWIERAPNGGPYSVVRLAWVTGNVVSQVSVLDVSDPATVQQAVALALMQQKRLAGYL